MALVWSEWEYLGTLRARESNSQPPRRDEMTYLRWLFRQATCQVRGCYGPRCDRRSWGLIASHSYKGNALLWVYNGYQEGENLSLAVSNSPRERPGYQPLGVTETCRWHRGQHSLLLAKDARPGSVRKAPRFNSGVVNVITSFNFQGARRRPRHRASSFVTCTTRGDTRCNHAACNL